MINVLGDAGFGMCGMDIETAVREKIPILTVVLNNGVLGGYEKHIPIAIERYGLKNFSGDYAKVGETLGSYCEKVKRPEEGTPAIETAKKVVASGRPALLEIFTKEEKQMPHFWR